jgi:hypothetical protein
MNFNISANISYIIYTARVVIIATRVWIGIKHGWTEG